MIILIIYLLVGAIFNIIGPLTKEIKREKRKLKISSIQNIIRTKKLIPKWKVILFEIFLRILVLLFYPLIFLILLFDSSRKNSSEELAEENDKQLYFYRMGGEGIIRCIDCDYSERIVSFLHGFGEWSSTGFQCQKCGRFHAIDDGKENAKLIKCECGGSLEREKPLFCPKCQSKILLYLIGDET